MAKIVARWKHFWVENGKWADILQLLKRGPKEGDIFAIENLNPMPGQAKRLSIEFDEETTVFMPILNVSANEPLIHYNNPKAEGKMIEFAGADIADRFFTDDFDLVVSMVREFYETSWVKSLASPEDIK